MDTTVCIYMQRVADYGAINRNLRSAGMESYAMKWEDLAWCLSDVLSKRPDVIIIESGKFGSMTGSEFVEALRLRDEGKDVKIIMIVPRGDSLRHVEMVRNNQIDCIMQRPIEHGSIVQTIRAIQSLQPSPDA